MLHGLDWGLPSLMQVCMSLETVQLCEAKAS